MDALWQDIKHGVRSLARSPGFTVVAAVTLALGIGANSAIFSLVNAVLLTPLPFKDPSRLVRLYEQRNAGSGAASPDGNVSAHEYVAWSEQAKPVLEGQLLYMNGQFNITGDASPAVISALDVTAGFFEVLGERAVIGRTFLPGDDAPGAERLVVLSDRLWRHRFAADSNIIGRSITLDQMPWRVIGVAPASGDLDPDVWVPIDLAAEAARVGRHASTVIARLKPGVTIAQAQAALNVVARHLEEQYPGDNAGHRVHAVPLFDDLVGEARRPMLVALGAVGFVLLIACANVAHLLLTRGARRRPELALRAALGASRRRLVVHMLTESVLLSLAGGGLGLFIASWLGDLLPRIRAVQIPRLNETRIDLVVIGVTFAIALITGILSGIGPALRASRLDLREWLTEGARGTVGRGHRIADALVVSEIALAMVLLVGAGLMVRSFARLTRVNPGFDSRHVLLLPITLPPARYGAPESQVTAFDQLMLRLAALPGVRSVGATTEAPLYNCCNTYPLTIEGRPVQHGEEVGALFHATTPDYFRTLAIPLRRGRELALSDARTAVPLIRWWPQQPDPAHFNEPQAAPVALVNETMAQRWWPGQDPVGKRFRVLFSPWITVVGVVGDVHHEGLAAASRPEMYLAQSQEPRGAMAIMIRTNGEPMALAAAVREQVREFDHDLPVGELQAMDDVVHNSLGRPRFNAVLLGSLAGLALVLALVGIYGVISYSVAQRTHEIGVRTALGAEAGDVVRLVLGRFVVLTGTGIVVGLAGALALTRLMGTLLFDVAPTDPATFVGLAVLLAAVALLACYLPTRRAIRVDPLVALTGR